MSKEQKEIDETIVVRRILKTLNSFDSKTGTRILDWVASKYYYQLKKEEEKQLEKAAMGTD